MPCLNCGHTKTIDAHLIPQAFTREVLSERGEKHVVVHGSSDRTRTTNTGFYDKNILCGECDGLLGRHEHYAFELLKRFRKERPPPNKLITVSPLEGDKLVKFAAGVCWKFCVTKPEYGQISIGPYESRLSDISFEKSILPSSIDLCAFYLQVDSYETYFYRAPKLDRKEGVNVIRFSLGGFVFFLKIDRRPNPKLIPTDCWFRGKKSASIGTLPAEVFEEWHLHNEFANSPYLKRYFKQMRDKY